MVAQPVKEWTVNQMVAGSKLSVDKAWKSQLPILGPQTSHAGAPCNTDHRSGLEPEASLQLVILKKRDDWSPAFLFLM